jgi:putative transcription factor
MPACELCGKTGATVRAMVEKVQMEVCHACSRFGRVLERRDVDALLHRKRLQAQPKREEPQIAVVPDYAERIRKRREQLGIKQIDLARMVAEKESMVQKMEAGQFEPNIELARKLERKLGISLVQEEKGDVKLPMHEKAEGFTLGHFLKK